MKIATLFKFKDSSVVEFKGLEELLKAVPAHSIPAVLSRFVKGYQKDDYIVFQDTQKRDCIYKLKDIASVEFIIDPIRGDE
ncbi:hypothetical protein [Paenibacillus donghaensis]|uniref:Uncharacterized protein n=1 Tax=Paenibacillus donghaensis TaxID=414771 RepID=A0A2Z2K6K3_9BACL|nr:hypothetical protein [Paenibacillus donghaensis]ASA21816.1 hypothetical protein B9T62_14160 [Paenibacillus donghaensis]